MADKIRAELQAEASRVLSLLGDTAESALERLLADGMGRRPGEHPAHWLRRWAESQAVVSGASVSAVFLPGETDSTAGGADWFVQFSASRIAPFDHVRAEAEGYRFAPPHEFACIHLSGTKGPGKGWPLLVVARNR
jgi:hypothetical protein